MASTSSKALPFITLALAFTLVVLDNVAGFNTIDLLQTIAPILAITAGGGLVNKAIDSTILKAKMLKAGATVQEVTEKTKQESST